MKRNIYIVTLMWLILDQFSKILVVKNLAVGKGISLIPQFFDILYVQNKGAAWGIMDGATIILTAIAAFAFILINKYLLNKDNFSKLEVISYGLLLGGILGNFIDRVIHSYVIDFLSFTFGSYQFPVFNIADIGIVVGVILLIIEIIRSERDGNHCKKDRC